MKQEKVKRRLVVALAGDGGQPVGMKVLDRFWHVAHLLQHQYPQHDFARFAGLPAGAAAGMAPVSD